MDVTFEVIQDEDYVTVRFNGQTLFEGQLRPGLSQDERQLAIDEVTNNAIARIVIQAIEFGYNMANSQD